jgi:16S rRNA (guanine527-N7)-methyltransferase
MFAPDLPALQPSAAIRAMILDAGILLEQPEWDALGRYLAFLRATNEHTNLTAIVEPEAMWERHIADSLSLLPVIASLSDPSDEALADGEDAPIPRPLRQPGEPLRLIDVGSGGGLPGIPLAICLPDVEVTLLEATGKKVQFLEEVKAALNLPNLRVVQGRAEVAGRDRNAHRERYDIVVSRAVGVLATLVELTVPFAKLGGMILAIKGERAAEEIVEAKQALYALHAHALAPLRTPTGTIVPVRKMRTTPKIYPRAAGEPKRVPLGIGKADRRRDG